MATRWLLNLIKEDYMGFNCYLGKVAGVKQFTSAGWLFFYPRCSRINRAIGMCSGSGAYVAAITVCNQRLF